MHKRGVRYRGLIAATHVQRMDAAQIHKRGVRYRGLPALSVWMPHKCTNAASVIVD
jgi:hypothetical protein